MIREQEKNRILAYEVLFSPIAVDVLGYLDAFSSPHGDSISPKYRDLGTLRERIVAHIWGHISHSRGLLLKRAASLSSGMAFREGAGAHYRPIKYHLDLMNAFVVEYHETLSRIGPHLDVKEIYWYRFCSRLLVLIYSTPTWSPGELVMHLHLYRDKISPRSVKRFERATYRFLDCYDPQIIYHYLDKNVFALLPTYRRIAEETWVERSPSKIDR